MKNSLLVAVFLSLFSIAHAQEFGQRKGFRGIVPKKEKTVILNEVEVSTAPMGESYAKASRHVVVLTAKEIQELPVQNINELLDMVSGVDMRQRGPLDVQGDLGIRGGTFDQTLILVNGARMNNPQTGHHNMNLPVPLAMIDRIEIIHGGAANAHGIGAMTGVVNIVLKKVGRKLNAGYSATTGKHDLINSSFYGGMSLGKWAFQLGHQFQQTSGYIANTDFTSDKLFFQLSRDWDFRGLTPQVQMFYGDNNKAFGAQNFYTTAFPDQFEATTTKLFGLNSTLPLSDQTTITFNTNTVSGTDRFELYRETEGLAGYDASPVAYTKLSSGRYYRAFDNDTAATWYSGPNFHRTVAMNSTLRIHHKWNIEHSTTLGMTSRSDRINSNVLGEDDETVVVPGWESYRMTKGMWSADWTYFIDHRFERERLKINGGLMVNDHYIATALAPQQWFWAPTLDATYRLTSQATLFGTANRSVRYPTFTDLYYNRGGAQGSITLQPETSWNLEAGYKFYKGNVHWTGVLFHRQSKDLIDWVTYDGDPTAYASNITELSLTGLEGAWQYRASKRRKRLQKVNVTATVMNGRTREVDFSSLYALDYLQAKVNARATQKLGLGLFATYSITVQDRVGTYYSGGQEIAYDPFALIDLKVYYAPAGGIFKRQFPFQAFINVNNALDAAYYDRGNVVQPGRWISTGFEFRFR